MAWGGWGRRLLSYCRLRPRPLLCSVGRFHLLPLTVTGGATPRRGATEGGQDHHSRAAIAGAQAGRDPLTLAPRFLSVPRQARWS